MSRNLQLNIYLKRNNHACMVFKQNGILYRINNLIEAIQFVANMKELSAAVKKGAMEDAYLDLYDHRGKIWVLECTLLNGLVSLKLWFQSKSSGEHLDVRFSWDGDVAGFTLAVYHLTLMADLSRLFRIYRK